MNKAEARALVIEVLNYAQPDEERDYEEYGDALHIVHKMRRLRKWAEKGQNA